MPQFSVQLANCLISGESVSTLPRGGWRRDIIELQIGRDSVVLRQTAEGLARGRDLGRGKSAHTSTLEFGEVPESRQRRAEQIAVDLGWLLSFATMSPVTPFRYNYGRSARAVRVSRSAQVFRPTIELADGTAIRQFIESTWPHYRKLKSRRKLAAVFDYLLFAEQPHQPFEVSSLLVFTALESLKATHSPGVRAHFQSRVEEMLRDVGMRRGLKQLVDLRNRLVHQGLAGVPYRRLRNHHDRLHDILREYLLRLLNYRGSYLLYSAACRELRTL